MKILKIFLLIALLLLPACQPIFAAQSKDSQKIASRTVPLTNDEQKILRFYNDYVFEIKQFARINYNYSDANLIDETLLSVLNMQSRVYIDIKSINKYHTKYTSLSFYGAFDVINQVALKTINDELDAIHRMVITWNNKKSIKSRERGGTNLMIYNNMSNRMRKLWNIFYSWDLRMNTLVKNTDLYPAYCILSKTTEGVLADHKLAIKVLWEKWVLDDANILYDSYEPIEYVRGRVNKQ